MMPKNISTPSNVVAVDFSKKRSVQVPTVSDEDRALNDKKRALFEKWLADGCVSMLFDARAPGVLVPSEFSARGDLRLNFSYDFMLADFSFNEIKVWATLSFDSGEFYCSVPWSSVYGLQSEKLHQGAVWFDSFPDDYDQMQVLGFSEDMCDQFNPSITAVVDDAREERDNVVAFNFSPDKEDTP